MTNQMVSEMYVKRGKAIIVGAGLGGLATAALLAKNGFSVTTIVFKDGKPRNPADFLKN